MTMSDLVTPWSGVIVLSTGTACWVVRAVVRGSLQRWRERSALTYSCQVYRAGGDAAAVLRAVASSPNEVALGCEGCRHPAAGVDARPPAPATESQ